MTVEDLCVRQNDPDVRGLPHAVLDDDAIELGFVVSLASDST